MWKPKLICRIYDKCFILFLICLVSLTIPRCISV
uniref:Uncharacterized protein n=1 Tax=Arundo donax TaxID=35708 RepID=A0A0A9BMJ8_ARUDO